MWSDEETDTLWSYVEKFQLQLYHGKDNMTRPQVIGKITALLSEYPACRISHLDHDSVASTNIFACYILHCYGCRHALGS